MKYLIFFILGFVFSLILCGYLGNNIIKKEKLKTKNIIEQQYQDSTKIDTIFKIVNSEELQNKIYYYHNNWSLNKKELENLKKEIQNINYKNDSLLLEYNDLKKVFIETLEKELKDE